MGTFFTLSILLLKTMGATIALFYINWKLTLLVISFIPIKFILSNLFSKKTIDYSEKQLQLNKKYNSWYEDTIEGIIDIKLWGLKNKKLNELNIFIDKQNMFEKNIFLLRTKKFTTDRLIDDVLLYILYFVGFYYVLSSKMTVGSVITLATYSSFLLTSVNLIINLKLLLDEIKPAIHSLDEYFAMEVEETGNLDIPDDIKEIKFINVNYQINGRKILDNVNLTIRAGEKIAIIGENGSGKTTLLHMLLRLLRPTSGHITINNIPIENFDIEKYRFGVCQVSCRI